MNDAHKELDGFIQRAMGIIAREQTVTLPHNEIITDPEKALVFGRCAMAFKMFEAFAKLHCNDIALAGAPIARTLLELEMRTLEAIQRCKTPDDARREIMYSVYKHYLEVKQIIGNDTDPRVVRSEQDAQPYIKDYGATTSGGKNLGEIAQAIGQEDHYRYLYADMSVITHGYGLSTEYFLENHGDVVGMRKELERYPEGWAAVIAILSFLELWAANVRPGINEEIKQLVGDFAKHTTENAGQKDI